MYSIKYVWGSKHRSAIHLIVAVTVGAKGTVKGPVGDRGSAPRSHSRARGGCSEYLTGWRGAWLNTGADITSITAAAVWACPTAAPVLVRDSCWLYGQILVAKQPRASTAH